MWYSSVFVRSSIARGRDLPAAVRRARLLIRLLALTVALLHRILLLLRQNFPALALQLVKAARAHADRIEQVFGRQGGAVFRAIGAEDVAAFPAMMLSFPDPKFNVAIGASRDRVIGHPFGTLQLAVQRVLQIFPRFIRRQRFDSRRVTFAQRIDRLDDRTVIVQFFAAAFQAYLI